ncbi:hypothetical protein NLU13_7933 [Sarocladium strictum]|uniref:ABC transporter domain-containing protein n=1 Tax=Sarocladium strictum TaxID=5046 RepID=A0AA39L622_SARSR|nr:hypothetical protein NLU13_7933 [Sarocladium strictum]
MATSIRKPILSQNTELTLENIAITESSRVGESDAGIGSGLTIADGSTHAVEPVEVEICQLSVEISRKSIGSNILAKLQSLTGRAPLRTREILLHSVTANLQPGSLTAVIGASGSGKSTLLDALSGRLTSGRSIRSGSILYNGSSRRAHIRRAYVTQQDVLLPTLTVRETLQYTADLRVPPPATASDRRVLVERVIEELGLQKCANTRIGDSRKRGCSGGERRRVSVGVQLLANPSLLFLDEPTTGLDAASALALTTSLRALCQRNRVVVMTVHQPRPEIWSLFDNLIVLAQGSTLYAGPIDYALPWFEGLGFTRPPLVNPSDFLVDISAVDYRTGTLESRSMERLETLRQAWQAKDCDHSKGSVAQSAVAKHHEDDENWGQSIGLYRQIRVLTHRTLRVTCRDPLGLTACMIEAVLMGLAVGYIFFDMARDQAGIKSREGCLYVAASLQGYLILIFETFRMSFDISTYDREASDGYVQPAGFILSRRLAKIPTEDLPVPLILSSLIYFMTGLDRDAGNFFTFFAISILNHYLAVLCATLCVVASRDFSTATLIASLVYTLQSLASGLIIHVDNMPVYIGWTRWITYSFYTFSAYVANEFEGSFYDCPFAAGRGSAKCIQYEGDFVIETLGFPSNWTKRAIACMAGFSLVFLISSVIALQFLTPSTFNSISQPRQRADPRSRVQETPYVDAMKVNPTTVELCQYTLTLSTKTLKGCRQRFEQKHILQPINVTFEPGMLHIVLGPSGCGKTSLLDSIGQRLRPTIWAKYVPRGSIRFNGTKLTAKDLRTRCAYATQEGELLLPGLTVRETLQYAAALRLGTSSDVEQRADRVEGLLCTLGLKACSDSPVGTDNFRGISGGEKRRLALAIQILNGPQVLLVDEPTSGLDSFTANATVQLLHQIAKSGRTVIVAIHQPRSDLFEYFGKILLLSDGGCPIYSGPARDMVTYFTAAGFECPLGTNPADFALDLVNSSRGSLFNGGETRERLYRLKQHWRCNGWQGVSRDSESSPLALRENAPRYPSFQTRSSMACISQLLRRAATNTCRQPQLVLSRFMQSSGVALIFTIFFAPLGNNYSSIQDRFGLFQQLGGFYIIGMLTNAAVYPFERDVAYSEIQDGLYCVEHFLASYTVFELPFEVINSLFLGFLLVFAVGLPRTVASYFIATLSGFTGLSCGESLGIMFNTLFSHTGFAMNMMGILMALANTMAGVLSLNMPVLFTSFNYLSPIRYQVRAVAYYSLVNQTFDCNLDQGCPILTGDEALQLYHFDSDPIYSILGMVLCVLIYRLLAWLLLRIVGQVRSN